jgi:kynurenine formamidase
MRYVDLTHTLTDGIPTWSGNQEFEHKLYKDYNMADEYKFRKFTLFMHEGSGTHMDSPLHCDPNGKTIADIDPNDLINRPCFVIDIPNKDDVNYLLSKEDVIDFEKRFGQITKNSFVLVRTGWSRLWNEPEKYRNNCAFPAVSAEAARLLIERDVVGLGVDTLSPDRGDNGFPVHNIFLHAGKYLVENINNPEQLPETGSTVSISPIKTLGAEAPVRMIGLVP